jgi:hypothetical protein
MASCPEISGKTACFWILAIIWRAVGPSSPVNKEISPGLHPPICHGLSIKAARGAKHPFFVMWVGNAELLSKAASSDRSKTADQNENGKLPMRFFFNA